MGERMIEDRRRRLELAGVGPPAAMAAEEARGARRDRTRPAPDGGSRGCSLCAPPRPLLARLLGGSACSGCGARVTDPTLPRWTVAIVAVYAACLLYRWLETLV